jgi:hypothetical protein
MTAKEQQIFVVYGLRPGHPKNILIVPMIISKLELGNVERHIFTANLSQVRVGNERGKIKSTSSRCVR